MKIKTHFSLTLLCSYLIFDFLFHLTEIYSISLSLITAIISIVPDLDWKIYGWSNRKIVKFNKNRILKYSLFPIYVIFLVLNKIFKHRTTTHSLFVPILFFILSFKFNIFLLFSIAFLCHIFQDVFTISGVPLFYPLSKKNYRIPVINTRRSIILQNIITFLSLFIYIWLIIY